MGTDEERRITVRLPVELTDWIDGQILDKKRDGVASTLTKEIEIAIRQRMISKLPLRDRERLFRRLGLERREEVERDDGHDAGDGTEAGDGLLGGEGEDAVGDGTGDPHGEVQGRG